MRPIRFQELPLIVVALKKLNNVMLRLGWDFWSLVIDTVYSSSISVKIKLVFIHVDTHMASSDPTS